MRITRDSSETGYTIPNAVEDVFGYGYPWLVVCGIVAAGGAGALLSPLFIGAEGAEREYLRPFACAAYGIAVASFVMLTPHVWKLIQLGSTLSRRPSQESAGDNDRPWWPLRLVAASLLNTPSLRRTVQDFNAAVAAASQQARGLLSHRMWPACTAAFIAPVLGLLSAWGTARGFANNSNDTALTLPMVISTVALPMILSISVSLILMVALVMVDQMTKGLLQRWSTQARPIDAESNFVRATLTSDANENAPTTTDSLSEKSVYDREPPRIASEGAAPNADQLKELGKIFGNE